MVGNTMGSFYLLSFSLLLAYKFLEGNYNTVEMMTATDENLDRKIPSDRHFPDKLIALESLSDTSSQKSPEQKPKKAIGSHGIRCGLKHNSSRGLYHITL